MSLVTTLSASPSRLRGIYRYLLHTKDQREEKNIMAKVMMPEPMINMDADRPRVAFEATLVEGRELALFDESREDESTFVGLHPNLSPEARDPDTADVSFPDLVVTLVFGDEGGRNDDLGHAVAWLLSRSPYDTSGDAEESLRELVRDGCSELSGITNKATYNQAVYWAMHLGFLWQHARERDTVIVADPTEFIRCHLPDLFDEPNVEVSVPSFIQRLAEYAPVFEGGRFREAVEERIGGREPGHLSESTTFALLRLEGEKYLELHMRSDAAALNFPVPNATRRFSHITWINDR